MEKQWYAVRTYTGQEEKVKTTIERRLKSLGLGLRVARILVRDELCSVAQIKTKESGGHNAVQVGFEHYPAGHEKNGRSIQYGRSGNRAKVRPTQSELGHFTASILKVKRLLGEFRFAPGELKRGEEIKADLFKAGDIVKVQGTSNGKGVAGVMKRHHLSGQRASYGVNTHRKPASLGATKPDRGPILVAQIEMGDNSLPALNTDGAGKSRTNTDGSASSRRVLICDETVYSRSSNSKVYAITHGSLSIVATIGTGENRYPQKCCKGGILS